jgi:hypothetical protein
MLAVVDDARSAGGDGHAAWPGSGTRSTAATPSSTPGSTRRSVVRERRSRRSSQRGPGMNDLKVESLLRGKVGRALLASLADVPEWKVAGAVGVDLGGTPYSDSATQRSPVEWRGPDTARARWHEACQVVEEAVGQGIGSIERELRAMSKYQLLRRVGDLTENMAFGGGADWLVLAPALEAAREELRPVAEFIAGLPEAAWWWDPVARDSQRWLAERNAGLPRGDRLNLGLREAARRSAGQGWWASELIGSDVPPGTRQSRDVGLRPAVS